MKLIREFKIECIVVILYISVLLSINSQSSSVLSFLNNRPNLSLDYFLLFLNASRFIFPFFSLLFLLGILIFLNSRFKKPNPIILTYFLYVFFQFFSTLANPTSLNFNNVSLLINAMSILLIFYIAENFCNKKIFKILVVILLLFISAVALIISFNLIHESLTRNLRYIYSTLELNPTEQYFSSPSIRITGVSRMLVIIYIFLFCVTIFKNKIKLFNYFLLVLLGLIVWLTQSRGGFVGAIILFLFYIVFYKKKFIYKLLLLLAIVVAPIFAYELIHTKLGIHKCYDVSTKSYIYNCQQQYPLINGENGENVIAPPLINDEKFLPPTQNPRVLETGDSGRVKIWQKSIGAMWVDNKFIGYGIQGDRYALSKIISQSSRNKNIVIYANNSSSAIIYAFLSAGYPGLILIAIFYVLVLNKIYISQIKNKNYLTNNFWLWFCIVTIFYLLIRGIYENGFSVFSLDLTIVFTSIFYCQNAKKIT